MCKLPCFEGKHCKNMQTHFKKHGIWRILWQKNADNGAKCRLDSFSGRRRRGYLKFPSLGGPHAGEKIKHTHCADPQGGGGKSWPWTAGAADGCEAFWHRDANNMHKCLKNQQLCKLLSPSRTKKKPAAWAATPREAGWINHPGIGVPQ